MNTTTLDIGGTRWRLKLGLLDWVMAVLVAGGAAYALQRYGASMDGYETGILIGAVPFLVALALAYLWDPVVDRLERLALALEGVQQAFAIQAGREIRVVVSPQEVTDDRARDLAKELRRRIEAELGYPCFVKPANLGSSVGISKATNRTELLAGLREAASHDPRLVVEQGVNARELECAVLGRRELRASVLGEICFDADWYDYTTKYSDGLSHTVIPAEVPPAISDRARELAIAACRAVAAEGLARVDFFYDRDSGALWLNEINTLPGFTSQSMYPMLWEASGLPLDTLVHELVQLAQESGQPAAGRAEAA